MNAIDKRIEQIVEDREHGSRWLVRETMELLYDLVRETDASVEEVRLAGQKLAEARPAMAALAGAVRRIVNAPDGLPGMAQEARRLLEEYDAATGRIVEFARPVLKGTLLTHSVSGTVLDVLVACKEQIERVIALEGRPRYEGREMARGLAKQGIAVTLITDAQADIFLPHSNAVVVGADTILANGDVLNKAGTALLGWAAQGHGVPLYVLSETLKITSEVWPGDKEGEEKLEEKEAEEVLETPLEGVTARNFYFDHTPTLLVTKIITERGMMGPKEVREIADGLPPLPF